jgi:hypothetical protein
MNDDREVMKVDMGAEGTRMVTASFPSNSHTAKQQVTETKKVERIVKGKVMKQKKSLGKKFMETFIGEDVGSVSSYIIHDILIPAAKSMVTDMVQGGIEMLLFGERTRGGGRSNSRDRGKSYVSYSNFSNRDKYEDRDRRRDYTNRNKANHNFEDIVLSSRAEATDVLNHLVDLIQDYGEATVADLYGMVGIREEHTDRKYGWMNLASARVRPIREGFLLDLPRPILLD